MTCLWGVNRHTNPLSGSYSENDVEKLYRGFKRNLTAPFRFVCFVDRKRKFSEPIEQELLSTTEPDYGSFTEPYRLNEPMILVGLDTIIVRNIDHFAKYCHEADKIALCRDPKSFSLKSKGYPNQSINGVAFVPKGWRKVYDEWTGANDMQHLRRYPWVCIDDKWPDEVVSFKLRVRPHGLGARNKIVFFHGVPKPGAVDADWVRENWV